MVASDKTDNRRNDESFENGKEIPSYLQFHALSLILSSQVTTDALFHKILVLKFLPKES